MVLARNTIQFYIHYVKLYSICHKESRRIDSNGMLNFFFRFVFIRRVVQYWKYKNTDSMIRGYKMNLQQFLGTRFPNAILNIVFKFRFSRKVSEMNFR